VRETYKDRLKSHGLNVTAQRLTVLQTISDFPHITAEQATEIARNHLGSISRQSVYDTLNTLVEKGLARRIQPIDSPALFEDRVGDNHHHLVCRTCDVVVDVDCAVGLRPCLEASDNNNFIIDEAEVTYWGLCPKCQPKNSSVQTTTTTTTTTKRKARS
jgi:Fur family ferric uptake transcriptional regulator